MFKKSGIGLGTIFLLFLFFSAFINNSNSQTNTDYVVWEYPDYIISFPQNQTESCSGCHLESSQSSININLPFMIKVKNLELGKRYIAYLGDNLIRVIEIFEEKDIFFSIEQEKIGIQQIWIGEIINQTISETQIDFDFQIMDIMIIEITDFSYFPTELLINLIFTLLLFFIMIIIVLSVLRRGSDIESTVEAYECHNCNSYNHLTDKFCYMCGYELEGYAKRVFIREENLQDITKELEDWE